MTKHIPNLVTLLNAFSGCIAVIFAVNGSLPMAAFFVCLGIFFDFFDGLLARKLNVQSELGLQLDSLADMITSGFVPGLTMYYLLEQTGNTTTLNLPFNDLTSINILPFFGFLITLASAYRLAKFNIDDNQTNSFIGLPTPANTLLIMSLPLILKYQANTTLINVLTNQWFLIGFTLLSCFLLNCNIKLLALKFKTWDFKSNTHRYALILIAILSLLFLKFTGIPVIIITYIIISYLKK